MDYPKHLERHKRIYERKQKGETYVEIAHQMRLSRPRVREMALRWKRELERRTSAQAAVASAVEGRGYREGWTTVQFLARQVAKLQEELGELSELITAPERLGPQREVVLRSYWQGTIALAALCSQVEFDDGGVDVWGLAQVEDLEAVKEELADLQVVLFCAASAVGELGGEEFDVVEAAVRKARGDEGRGIRE